MGDDITRGERGPAGDKGAHGQAGDVGLTGQTGLTGHEGIPGEKGERGDTGLQGKSTILSRHVSVSFLLLAVVGSIVLGILTFNILQNRGLIRDLDEQQLQLDRQQKAIAALSVSTNRALCSFVSNLRQRVESSEAYLADVQAGRRQAIQGITEQDIKQSLNGQKATLASLEPLHCPNGG